ncbi:iron compound ABC transporter iron compound-binding protein [Sporomusaceae bacterium FL31]|nr:iron compound ABC transporter iron compound-binding protein [Sporomusaceae bacterium FL31]GCE34008.1 iron compound ABC transporter iron compound-binding protein [Sporomusaceae bacterium]
MQVTKKNQTIAICIMLLVVLLAGCGRSQAPSAVEKSQGYLSITDDTGRTVVLPHKPEKIVVLSTSFLDLLYAVGGKAIGRPGSKTGGIPSAAQDVAEIGYVYNVNLEKVVSLQPDLVIAFQGIHDKLIPALESNKIPVILVRIKSYQDVVEKLKLFSNIAGTMPKGEELARDIDVKVNDIVAKVPDKQLKVAIIHATAKSVTVELDNSITGSIAKQLKLHNVASGSRALESDPDATPYSLEKLVETNPDMIFVVTMGYGAEVEKRMKADLESSPAWSTLAAVQNKQVHILPEELFLLNPGLRYPDAVAYMAKIAYPEVFTHVK